MLYFKFYVIFYCCVLFFQILFNLQLVDWVDMEPVHMEGWLFSWAPDTVLKLHPGWAGVGEVRDHLAKGPAGPVMGILDFYIHNRNISALARKKGSTTMINRAVFWPHSWSQVPTESRKSVGIHVDWRNRVVLNHWASTDSVTADSYKWQWEMMMKNFLWEC
jgi:hypothetical protein